MGTEMKPPNSVRRVTKRSLGDAAAQVWIGEAAAAVGMGANVRETGDDQLGSGGESILEHKGADTW